MNKSMIYEDEYYRILEYAVLHGSTSVTDPNMLLFRTANRRIIDITPDSIEAIDVSGTAVKRKYIYKPYLIGNGSINMRACDEQTLEDIRETIDIPGKGSECSYYDIVDIDDMLMPLVECFCQADIWTKLAENRKGSVIWYEWNCDNVYIRYIPHTGTVTLLADGNFLQYRPDDFHSLYVLNIFHQGNVLTNIPGLKKALYSTGDPYGKTRWYINHQIAKETVWPDEEKKFDLADFW